MATLTSTKIKNTYDSLLKTSDNDNITSSAKQITDGLGNGTPLYISTTQIGIGVTPEATYDLHVYSNAKVGGNLTVTGDLTVDGTVTTVSSETLTVTDPLIELAKDNTSSDALDIGFYGKYAPSGTTLYAGLFRDTGDSKFKLFRNLEEQPTTTVNTSGTGYTVATLVADVEGTLTGVIASTTTATTQSAGDNSTKVATTAYVDASIGNSTLSEVLVNGNTTSGTDISVSASDDITFTSTSKAIFGGSLDLQVYSDGSNNYIDSTSNELRIRSNDLRLLNYGTAKYITADNGADVSLYYNNSKKLETTTTGITVTGAVSATTFSGQLDGTISSTTTATTQTQGDNSTKVATTAYVDSAIGGQDTLSEVLANGNTTGGTDISVSSGDDITFADSSKILLGAGSDLQIYHDGSNSLILNDTGKLIIRNRADDQDIQFDCDNGSGGVETYFYLDGSATNTRFPKDIKLNDSTKAIFGGGGDLEIYHDSNNSYINESGTGSLFIKSSFLKIRNNSNESMIDAISDGAVNLYYDNSKKFETTSSGIEVTSNIVLGQNKIDGSSDNFKISADYGNVSGSSTIEFLIDNDEKVRINNSGQVGIGYGDPQQKIHIVDTNGSNIILNSNTAAENNGIFMTEAAQTSPYTNGAYVFYDSANNAFKIQTGTSTLTTRLTIDRDSGNATFGDGTGNTFVTIDAGNPIYLLKETDQSADNKVWGIQSELSALKIRAFNDALSSATNVLTFTRAGIASFINNIDIIGNNKHIRFVDSYGNWQVKVGDGANNFKIHSQSLAADYLTLEGGGQLNLGEYGSGSFTGTATYRLAVDSSGDVIEIPIGGGAVDGSGAAGQVAVWSDTDTITGYTRFKVYDAGGQIQVTDGTRDIRINSGYGGNTAMIGTSSSHDLGFMTGNSQRVTIDTSGNVGIGTNSPDGIFKAVSGTSPNAAQILIGYNNTSENYFDANTQIFRNGSYAETMRIDSSGSILYQTGSGKGYEFGASGSSAGVANMFCPSGYTLAFGTNNAERMRIDSSGNINIGTGAASDTYVRIYNAGTGDITAGYQIYNGSNLDLNIYTNPLFGNSTILSREALAIRTGGSERMRIHSNGRVSIGSTTASANTLTLSGTATEMDMTNTSTNGRQYRLESDSGGNFVIKDRTANVDRIVLDSSGRVGIGKSPITWKLDVDSSDVYAASFDTSNNVGVVINGNNTTASQIIGYSNSVSTYNALHLRTNSTTTDGLYIDSSGNVGIGTTSPTADLSVGSTSTSSGDIHLRTTKTTFSMTPSNTDAGGVSLDVGWVSGGQGPFKFAIGGSEKMRIDSSGKVLVGKTSSNLATEGVEIRPDEVLITKDGGSVLTLNRLTSDGNIIVFAKDTSTVGSIGSNTTGGQPLLDIAGATGNSNIRFLTTNTERLRIDSSGTTSVIKTSAGSSTTPLVVRNAGSTNVGTESKIFLSTVANDDRGAYISSIITDSSNGNALVLATNTAGAAPTERMRIDSSGDTTHIASYSGGTFPFRVGYGSYSSFTPTFVINDNGNVGIGTTSPLVELDVVDDGNSYIQTRRTNATASTLRLGSESGLNLIISRDASTGNMPLAFYTGTTERMRITSAGAVAIGTTGSSTSRLHIKAPTGTADMCTIQTGDNANNNVAAIVFRDSTFTHCGEIAVNGSTNTTNYSTGSDYRLKEDYQDFNGLDLVSNIPVYDFQWKKSGTRAYGVQAHELQEVLPQAVVGEKDGEKYQSVDYSKVVPILLKSIQELKQEIETLKAQINN